MTVVDRTANHSLSLTKDDDSQLVPSGGSDSKPLSLFTKRRPLTKTPVSSSTTNLASAFVIRNDEEMTRLEEPEVSIPDAY